MKIQKTQEHRNTNGKNTIETKAKQVQVEVEVEQVDEVAPAPSDRPTFHCQLSFAESCALFNIFRLCQKVPGLSEFE